MDEVIDFCCFLDHLRLDDIPKISPSERQKNKGIKTVVDVKKFVEQQQDLVFESITKLKEYINSNFNKNNEVTDRFWDSDEINGQYMEVILTDEDGDEHIYWVNLENKQDDEDEYDWPINVSIAFHNNKCGVNLTEDDAEAMEPFSRNETEFTFIN